MSPNSPWRGWDETALARLFASISIDTNGVLEEWNRDNRPHAGRTGASATEVDLFARQLIADSARKAAAIGVLGGLGGLALLPHEVLATLVASVRLAQRLALLYGLDPNTDAGHLAVLHALAAGLEVEAPDRGLNSVKVSDLPTILVGQARLHAADVALGQLLVRAATRAVAGRILRLVPLLSSAIGGYGMHATMLEMGERMRAVLSRLGAPLARGPGIEDAVVIEG